MLTGAGRGLSLTRRVARHLPMHPPDVLELDVTVPEHVDDGCQPSCGHGGEPLDGVLHSIGFAPRRASGAGSSRPGGTT